MWFIVKMLEKYCGHETFFFFFLLFHRFRNLFPPPPIFSNVIATIAKFFFLFPYFSNGIATNSLSIFFFPFQFGHSMHTWAAELGTGNLVFPLPKVNIFSLHLFLLLSYTCGWISATVIPKFNLSPQNPK